MLFTSYQYWLVLLLAFGIYWAATRLRHKRLSQNITLLVMSYSFYAWWDWRWCVLLAAISAISFWGAHWIHRTQSRQERRIILIILLFISLGALGVLKYFNFFTESFASMLSSFGLTISQPILSIIIPIGLSYYTFQSVSYLIDVYRQHASPSSDVLAFFVALSFFPQLLAGPITRPVHLLPQLTTYRTFKIDIAKDGIRQFLWGLIKKMLVANGIGTQVDYIWSHYTSLDGLSLCIGAFLYSIQIYCDFSGYADMAIGSGKLFGIKLANNFSYPYFSTSIRTFWHRWHISLSTWARDYIYIPLGGNRVRTLRHAFNLILTFSIIGVWHGANWTFVAWGVLHGLYQLPGAVLRRYRLRTSSGSASTMKLVGSGVMVFFLVSLAWVLFRAPTITDAFHYITTAISRPYLEVDHLRYLPWLGGSVALLIWEGIMSRREHGLDLGMIPVTARWATYLALCVLLLLGGYFGNRAGIYVQF
ncbi:MAG: MBOAT family O-acyltransferase [Thermoleophilia bacterium]|jgi:alginate O-acetyltransferase complex protein AlgI